MPTTTTTASTPAPAAGAHEAPIVVTRRRIDRVLIGIGALAAVVFLVAGALLMWGKTFSDDYVTRELTSQNIVFPSAESLQAQGRDDLVKYAGQPLDSGAKAEAYASYIDGHLDGIADGLTYAELGAVETAAQNAVQDAVDSDAPQSTVDELQAEADRISEQRNTLFKGETLRGLLLSAYAWSTVGMIAGIAAIGAFVASGAAAVLVVLGLLHMRRMQAS